jgi:hypothetical protein
MTGPYELCRLVSEVFFDLDFDTVFLLRKSFERACGGAV